MEIVGLDLAGKKTNDTGVCLLKEVEGDKTVSCLTLKSDQKLLEFIKTNKPDLVAIDAPLTFKGETRYCDRVLAEYGALSPTLPGMRVLADRGGRLAQTLFRENIKVIEVFARACSKILGVADSKDYNMQKKMMGLELLGDINTRLLTRDELDAVCCAITGYLHLMGKTKTVGEKDCEIILPEI